MSLLKTLSFFMIGFLIGGSLAVSNYFKEKDKLTPVPKTNVEVIKHEISKLSPFKADTDKQHGAIIMLSDADYGFFCSAVVFDDNYAATAAHCLWGEGGSMTNRPIIILDEQGKSTQVVAKAVGMSSRLDFGLIKGDFRNHKKLKLDVKTNGFRSNGNFVACGFPQGQKGVTCHKFVPISTFDFFMRGISHLIPGMSGGPVIDVDTGSVIGVNSSVKEEYSFVTPLTGFFGAFELD